MLVGTGRFGLILHGQQGQAQRLTGRSRPVDLLAHRQTEQGTADRREDRHVSFRAGVLGKHQGQVVILAAAFLAAMHPRIHRHHTGRHLVMAHHLGPRQLRFQSTGTRAEVLQAVEQALQTLQVETGDGDRRVPKTVPSPPQV